MVNLVRFQPHMATEYGEFCMVFVNIIPLVLNEDYTHNFFICFHFNLDLILESIVCWIVNKYHELTSGWYFYNVYAC